MNGKGSKPRPYSVPLTTFDNNYDTIFRKRKTDEEKFDDAIMKNEYYDEDLIKTKEKNDN